MEKRTKNSILLISVTLLFIAFVMVLNDMMITIRLNELRARLQQMDRTEGSIDHIRLVTTYETHKKLFENRISQEKADSIEHRVNSLTNIQQKGTRDYSPAYGILTVPVIQVINLNRYILGKSPLTFYREEDFLSLDLDLAYYYERNFLFKKAIALYDKTLENKKMTDSIRANIFLHQGYCYALSQQNKKARENYLTVINEFGRENSAITATILLRYLEGFRLARERVLKGRDDSLAQSRKLVHLLDFEQALAILEEVEKDASPSELAGIKFYKAQCYQGMGKPEQAVHNYLDIITAAPSSRYARYSNRKLYMIGTRGGKKDLVETSKKINTIIQDQVLTEMITKSKETTKEQDQVPDPLKVEIPQITSDKIEKMVSREKKPKAPEPRQHLVIYTSDGNRFKGALIKKSDDSIVLKTSSGTINIKRDRITRISNR